MWVANVLVSAVKVILLRRLCVNNINFSFHSGNLLTRKINWTKYGQLDLIKQESQLKLNGRARVSRCVPRFICISAFAYVNDSAQFDTFCVRVVFL